MAHSFRRISTWCRKRRNGRFTSDHRPRCKARRDDAGSEIDAGAGRRIATGGPPIPLVDRHRLICSGAFSSCRSAQPDDHQQIRQRSVCFPRRCASHLVGKSSERGFPYVTWRTYLLYSRCRLWPFGKYGRRDASGNGHSHPPVRGRCRGDPRQPHAQGARLALGSFSAFCSSRLLPIRENGSAISHLRCSTIDWAGIPSVFFWSCTCPAYPALGARPWTPHVQASSYCS
jgi:hypothetical protein